ncbi:spermatogenesis-associated serine-rich protein 1-like isoform X2 [Octopus sinensis]|uniref:Spermatogenesis-associated serine-rich protein 1-like isoform X2 n=1 Tax=Octopus sinensis TaxID=2607531 RepID=A0A7E6EHF0_9MOLL|nr:spermatogenesis-associated serine-rich protein 1-like isoform X2 [Octopus sinensis]
MLHIIENPKVTAENYPTVEDEWLFHQNCAKRIHTYLFGVSEATKLEFSKYYQLSAAKDREWLPIRKRPGKMIDKRNGRPCINLGDKFYKTVEFSPDFFKNGAPVSPPVFGIGDYLLVTEGNSN